MSAHAASRSTSSRSRSSSQRFSVARSRSLHLRACGTSWGDAQCSQLPVCSCFSRGLEDLRNCLRKPCQSDTVRHTQSHSRRRCGFLGHSSRYNRRSAQ
ncbi:unnamed protein product, partial [Ixodes hexagonus]